VYASVVDSLFVAISLKIYVGMEIDSDLAAWGIIRVFRISRYWAMGLYCEGGDE
jgi:hypothetical protein